MVGASLYTLKTIFSQINIWADSLGWNKLNSVF
jgi:hypothetical protein